MGRYQSIHRLELQEAEEVVGSSNKSDTQRVRATFVTSSVRLILRKFVMPRKFSKSVVFFGQRDYTAAVVLLHAAALPATVQRQSAVVKLAAHVEFLGITVIGSLKCARVLSCI
jgi:hypothetical protein